nr:low molecular weight protein-tyrosine-phosphatase [Wenjunlia vitaminophila]
MTAPSVRPAAPAPVMRAGSVWYRVCFVCTANICRSPMAASVFRTMVDNAGLSDLVKVSSAGTGGWFEGEGADLRTVAVLAANGYPDEHAARQFKPAWFVGLDLVVALDESHARFLRYLAPTARDVDKVRLLRSFDPAARKGELDVPDPYYGGIEHFRRCLELIEAASVGLLEAVAEQVVPPGRRGKHAKPQD